MTKKLLIILLIVVIAGGAVIGGTLTWRYLWFVKQEASVEATAEEAAKVIFEYAKRVQTKSSTMPEEIWIIEAEQRFSDILISQALEKVKNKEVFLRTTSNPHPGNIEIIETTRKSANGFIFETKHYVEYTGEGNIAFFPITFEVARMEGRFYISDILVGIRQEIKGGVEDKTAYWKTYRNEEYGFEVKYLPNWEIHFSDEPLRIYWLDPEEKVHYGSPYLIPLGIYIKEAKNRTLEDWISGKAEGRGEAAYVKIKEINVAGLDTIMVYDTLTMGAPWNLVFILKGDFVYKIQTPLSEEKFQQMLSTFKFIEQFYEKGI